MSNTPSSPESRRLALTDIPFADANRATLKHMLGLDVDLKPSLFPNNWEHMFFPLFYANGVNIGDGAVHPLSETFANLGAAQAQFPKATALTESLAWHCYQKAIDFARSSGGGTVVWPKGRFILRGPTDNILPLYSDRMPIAVPAANRAEVNIVGVSDNQTQLWYDTDRGANYGETYGLRCGDSVGDPVNQQADSRYGNNAMSAGFIRDIAFCGPDVNASLGMGVKGCKMSGMSWAPRRVLMNVRISGFYANLDVVGDHTLFQNVKLFNGYYNVYWNYNSPTMYGDIVWLKCQNEEARMANFGFHWGARMGNNRFVGRNFVGQAPYAFYKEPNPDVVPTGYEVKNNFLANVKFDDLFCEGLGNAMIWDGNFDKNGVCTAALDILTFKGLSLTTWNNNKKLTDKPRQAWKVKSVNGCQLEDISDIHVQGFTGPAFDFSGEIFGQFRMRGNIDRFLDACASSAGGQVMPFRLTITGDGPAVFAPRICLEHTATDGVTGSWTGRVYVNYPDFGAIAKGDIVGSQWSGVKPMADSDIQSEPLGVTRTLPFPNNPAVSGTNNFVVVAEESDYVPVNTTGTSSFQRLKKLTSTAGKVTDAASIDDGRIVGYGVIQSGTQSYMRFAKSMRSSRSGKRRVKVVTTSYTLLPIDHNSTIEINSSNAVNLTIPEALFEGFTCSITQTGVGKATFVLAGGGSLNVFPAGSTRTGGQWSHSSLYVASNVGAAPQVRLSGAVEIPTGSVLVDVPAADRLFQPFYLMSNWTGAPSVTSSATSATSRFRRVVPDKLLAGLRSEGRTHYRPKFTYVNWIARSTSVQALETNGSADITVGVAVEYHSNSATTSWAPSSTSNTVVQETFNGGASTAVIAPGAKLRSDGVAGIPIPASGPLIYYEVVYVAGASGWPLVQNLLPGGSNYDQIVANIDARAAVRGTTWTNTSVAAFGSVRIDHDVLSTSGVAPWLAIGDSITMGTGNNPSDASYFDRAAGFTTGTATTQGQIPAVIKIAQPGEQVSQWVADLGNGVRGYDKRMAMVAGLTFSRIHILFGTNDLANGRTFAQLQADYITLLQVVNNRFPNVPISVGTLLPRTNAAGTANPSTNFFNFRNQFNAWLFTIVGQYGITEVIDYAADLELTPGSQAGNGDNRWTDLRRHIDGIHPSGGTEGSGTAGSLGSTTAGGGHAVMAARLASRMAA